MYNRIAQRSVKIIRRRCNLCSETPTNRTRRVERPPSLLASWQSSGTYRRSHLCSVLVHCFSTTSSSSGEQKKSRIELSGRSLLFSLPVVDEGDESSDDEDDGKYAIGRPMFSDKISSLSNIKNYYMNEHGVKLTQSHFKCTKVSFKGGSGGSDLHAWTCYFTCPLTGKIYASGRLRKFFSALDEDDVANSKITTTDSYHLETNLYSKRRGAEHAAAARALDAIQYQKTGLVEPRFCEEAPDVAITIPLFAAAHNTPESTIAETTLSVNDLVDEEQVPASPILVDLQAPATYYFQEYGLKLIAENYATDRIAYQERDRRSASNVWTSIFTCPVSGRQFASGRCILHTDDDAVVDVVGVAHESRVFYRKKASAERAASRRAMDVIRYEKFGILEPRFCYEDPSTYVEKDLVHELPVHGETSSAEPVSLMLDRIDDEKARNASHSPEVVDVTIVTKNLLVTSDFSIPNDNDASSVDIVESDEPDDEDDYVVSHLSPSIEKTPPSQRLLQIASRVAGSGAVSGGSKASSLSSSSLPIIHSNPTRSAVDVANAWLASILQASASNSAEKGNPHRLSLPRNDSATVLVCGKTILASLAAVSQASPVGQSADIEPLAKKVIDTLWKTDKSKPDTDTYTLYLKCLDGGNPKVAVEKAETIVEAMVSRVKHKSTGGELPKPNQHTFNALIQISAQIGGTTGRIAKHTDQGFVPDRESFLSVLSSSVYRPVEEFEAGEFDPEFAKECIQRMSQLAVETSNPFFLPDTQVYNAPLRWSGGPMLWTKSRPYARYVPWDSYESIYAKGLRENVDDNDLRLKEARALEEWLDMMQERSLTNSRVAPDIETYEAVIQGWLRTATREGLDRAESIARRLLGKDRAVDTVQPRLQTFHPIIAAWYHCQHSESPMKSLEWIQHCEEHCLNDSYKLDMRILEMKMVACLNEQRRLLKDLSSESSVETKSKIVEAAVRCSTVLAAACEASLVGDAEGHSKPQPVTVKLFTDVIRAWENSVSERLGDAKSEEIDLALSEMVQAFDLFERLISMTVSSDTGHGVVLRGQDFSLQLEHLVLNSQTFFGCLVDALAFLGRKQDVAESLLLVEKMTRIVGEFDEIESHGFLIEPEKVHKTTTSCGSVTYSPFGRRVLHDDGFCYQVKVHGGFPITRHAFLWKVVRYMEQLSTGKAYASDIARLAALVKRIGSARRSSSKMDEAIDKLLDRDVVATRSRRPTTLFESNTLDPTMEQEALREQQQLEQSMTAASTDTVDDSDAKVARRAKTLSSTRPRDRKRRNSTKRMNGALGG